MTTKAFAAQSATAPLGPMSINRREPLPSDVEIDILYCGVCHSDLHFARNEWGMTQYPLVPGHEILGRVKRVGNKVSKFKVGDRGVHGRFVPQLLALRPRPGTVLSRRRCLFLRLA
jgi:uncharacterized zinc-type alcohol dehydrogenase-like protein